MNETEPATISEETLFQRLHAAYRAALAAGVAPYEIEPLLLRVARRVLGLSPQQIRRWLSGRLIGAEPEDPSPGYPPPWLPKR